MKRWVLGLCAALWVSSPAFAGSTYTPDTIPHPGAQTGARFESNFQGIKTWTDAIDANGDNKPDMCENVVDGAIGTAKLSFDPATQTELDNHKSGSDHDGRYFTKTQQEAGACNSATEKQYGVDTDGSPLCAADANSGGVSSFNARSGAITPADGDYTAAQVHLGTKLFSFDNGSVEAEMDNLNDSQREFAVYTTSINQYMMVSMGPFNSVIPTSVALTQPIGMAIKCTLNGTPSAWPCASPEVVTVKLRGEVTGFDTATIAAAAWVGQPVCVNPTTSLPSFTACGSPLITHWNVGYVLTRDATNGTFVVNSSPARLTVSNWVYENDCLEAAGSYTAGTVCVSTVASPGRAFHCESSVCGFSSPLGVWTEFGASTVNQTLLKEDIVHSNGYNGLFCFGGDNDCLEADPDVVTMNQGSIVADELTVRRKADSPGNSAAIYDNDWTVPEGTKTCAQMRALRGWGTGDLAIVDLDTTNTDSWVVCVGDTIAALGGTNPEGTIIATDYPSLQAAFDACPRGQNTVGQCHVYIPHLMSVSSTVALGDPHQSVNTYGRWGMTIECGSGMTDVNDTYDGGACIKWTGAAGGTVFQVANMEGLNVENVSIDAGNAGIAWLITGNNAGVGSDAEATSYVQSTSWQNDWVRFADTNTTGIGWLIEGDDPDGFETDGTGTVTSATGTTLSDSTKSWVTSIWETAGTGKCTSGHDETCYVYIVSGKGRGQIRAIGANTGTQLTVAYPWLVIPDTTSVYGIQAFAAGNGPCEHCDNPYISAQLDKNKWFGGGSRNGGECIQISNNQSLLNTAYSFECAGWKSPMGGIVVTAGQIAALDGYFGANYSGTGAGYHAYVQTVAGGILAAQYPRVNGNHWELGNVADGNIGNAVVIEYVGGSTDVGQNWEVRGNQFNMQGDNGTGLNEEYVLKVDNWGAGSFEDNIIVPTSTVDGANVEISRTGTYSSCDEIKNNTWRVANIHALFNNACIDTVNGMNQIKTTGTVYPSVTQTGTNKILNLMPSTAVPGGFFNDKNFNQVVDAGEKLGPSDSIDVPFTPADGIVATNVDAAIKELKDEMAFAADMAKSYSGSGSPAGVKNCESPGFCRYDDTAKTPPVVWLSVVTGVGGWFALPRASGSNTNGQAFWALSDGSGGGTMDTVTKLCAAQDMVPTGGAKQGRNLDGGANITSPTASQTSGDAFIGYCK